MGYLEEVPGSWLWIGIVSAVVLTWGVNHRTKDLPLSLSSLYIHLSNKKNNNKYKSLKKKKIWPVTQYLLHTTHLTATPETALFTLCLPCNSHVHHTCYSKAKLGTGFFWGRSCFHPLLWDQGLESSKTHVTSLHPLPLLFPNNQQSGLWSSSGGSRFPMGSFLCFSSITCDLLSVSVTECGDS